MIEIRHRDTGAVLFGGEYGSLKACVVAAVKAGANLADAYLAYADLAYADLARANLARAYLAYADLAHADLAHADLAYADLAYADLARANLARAYLADANLADANLAHAYLAGTNLADIEGSICNSHELLAAIALRFDESLTPVAAMIAGRYVGCWAEYTKAIRQVFGEDVMRRLWQAWSQDESWGVVEKMREHGWPAELGEEFRRGAPPVDCPSPESPAPSPAP